MHFLRSLSAWIRRRPSFEATMAEEMRLHLEHRIDQHVKAGLSPREARETALRAFGGVAQIQEACRDQRRGLWLEQLVRDVRYAARQLRTNPGFAAVAVITLALGTGATTAIFSIVNAVVLSPLPLAEPDRLVWVAESNPRRDLPQFSVSYANYRDWTERSRSWEGLGAFTNRSVNLLYGGRPEHVEGQFMTSNLLPLLRLDVARGRGFRPEEDAPGRGDVVILSDGLWKRVFSGDPNVVGQPVVIDGAPYTVVGIAPPRFGMAGTLDLFLPLGRFAQSDRGDHELSVIGRLQAGISAPQATAEMSALAGQIDSEHPGDDSGWGVTLMPLADVVVGSDTRRTLFFLFASVGVLLLIACANVAGLQLVRASSRTREIAIRTSLGGGRGRLVRQFVTESLVLAVLGGGFGLLVAYWGLDFFRSVAASLPRADEIRIDGRVLLVTAAATVVTGVVAGLLPALQASRLDVQHALKAAGPTVSAERRRLRDSLVIAQLALSIVLLASAGLMLRTLDRLYRTDLGFNAAQLLTLQVAPTGDHVQFLDTLLDRVGALPGVRSAAVTSGAPMSTVNTSVHVFPVGPARIPPSASIQSHWRIVTGGFFHAMQIPLLAGRVFAPSDDGKANKVVMVNRTLATTLWGDGDPIGRRVSPGGGDDYSTVIGVVADIRSHDPAAPPIPSFYMSAYAGMLSPMTVVVRAGEDPLALVPAIRSVVQSLDATAPVFEIKPMADLLGERVAARRTFAGLLTGFAALALALAAVGVYGVMAYATARRTREFGIRKALGARSRDLIGSVLSDGFRLVALGTAAGIAIALGVTRTMRGMLTGVEPADPLTFIGAALLLTAVTLLACYIPARRATGANPLDALRGE